MSRGSGSIPQVCKVLNFAISHNKSITEEIIGSSASVPNMEVMPMKEKVEVQNIFKLNIGISFKFVKTILIAIFLLGYGDRFSSSA